MQRQSSYHSSPCLFCACTGRQKFTRSTQTWLAIPKNVVSVIRTKQLAFKKSSDFASTGGADRLRVAPALVLRRAMQPSSAFTAVLEHSKTRHQSADEAAGDDAAVQPPAVTPTEFSRAAALQGERPADGRTSGTIGADGTTDPCSRVPLLGLFQSDSHLFIGLRTASGQPADRAAVSSCSASVSTECTDAGSSGRNESSLSLGSDVEQPKDLRPARNSAPVFPVTPVREVPWRRGSTGSDSIRGKCTTDGCVDAAAPSLSSDDDAMNDKQLAPDAQFDGADRLVHPQPMSGTGRAQRSSLIRPAPSGSTLTTILEDGETGRMPQRMSAVVPRAPPRAASVVYQLSQTLDDTHINPSDVRHNTPAFSESSMSFTVDAPLEAPAAGAVPASTPTADVPARSVTSPLMSGVGSQQRRHEDDSDRMEIDEGGVRVSTPLVPALMAVSSSVPSTGPAGAPQQFYAASSFAELSSSDDFSSSRGRNAGGLAGTRHGRTDDDGDPAGGYKRDHGSEHAATPAERHSRWTSMDAVRARISSLRELVDVGIIRECVLHRVMLREVEGDFTIIYRQGDGTSTAGYACVDASKACASFLYAPKQGVIDHLTSVASVTGCDGFPPLQFPPEVMIEHRLVHVPCPVSSSRSDDSINGFSTVLRCGLQPLMDMYHRRQRSADTVHPYLPSVLAVYVTMLDHVYGVARVSIVMPCPRYADKVESISFPISIQLPSTDEPAWHMYNLKAHEWPQSRIACMRGEIASAHVHLSRLLASSSYTVTIRNHREFPLPLPRPQAKAVVLQLLLALRHLHSRGFVHGSVKPDSILVDSWGMISGILYPHVRLANMRTCARMTPPLPAGVSDAEQYALCELARAIIVVMLVPQMQDRMPSVLGDDRTPLERSMVSAPYSAPEQSGSRPIPHGMGAVLMRAHSTDLTAGDVLSVSSGITVLPEPPPRFDATPTQLRPSLTTASTIASTRPLSLRSSAEGGVALSRQDSGMSVYQPSSSSVHSPVPHSAAPALPHFTPMMDIYALGATMFSLLTRAQPWPADGDRLAFPERFMGRQGVQRDAFSREELPVADALDCVFPASSRAESMLRDLLASMTARDPNDRPCAHHLIQHPWFKEARELLEPMLNDEDLQAKRLWNGAEPPSQLCTRGCNRFRAMMQARKGAREAAAAAASVAVL